MFAFMNKYVFTKVNILHISNKLMLLKTHTKYETQEKSKTKYQPRIYQFYHLKPTPHKCFICHSNQALQVTVKPKL